MIKNITIGSDPEFFIYQGKQVTSSIGIIKGTKWNPDEPEEGYGILKDNVLIEGNIPYANTREEFIHNMKHWKEIVSEILEIQGLMLVSADSAEFPKEMLQSEEAKTFGCAPYMNAWTLDIGNPADLASMNFRVAGCHIHIGYTLLEDFNYNKEIMDVLITRAFDYFVVYPSRKINNDLIRSKFYGDYGNYRNKVYGVECRSLGGFFTKDQYLGWIYDQTLKVLAFCSTEENCELLQNINSPEENTNENYNILEINLKEQLYGDITIATNSKPVLKQEA